MKYRLFKSDGAVKNVTPKNLHSMVNGAKLAYPLLGLYSGNEVVLTSAQIIHAMNEHADLKIVIAHNITLEGMDLLLNSQIHVFRESEFLWTDERYANRNLHIAR